MECDRARLLLALLSTALLTGPIARAVTPPSHARVASRVPTAAQRTRLGALALPFIENTGQVNKAVAFYAPTFTGTAFVTRRGALVLSMPGKPLTDKARPHGHPHLRVRRGPGWVLTETPVSTVMLAPRGRGVTCTHVSVFHGGDTKTWRSALKTYAAVDLGRPWPGVRYEIKAHGNNVERIFTVAPSAKASAIQMRVRGAERLSVDDDRLVAHTGNGPVTLSKPVAWQRIDGRRRPVRVAYVLKGESYGFRLGRHDRRRPVVIDPLLQATYLGGTQGLAVANDYAQAMAADSSGNIYVAGTTYSTDFPCTTASGPAPAGGGACGGSTNGAQPNANGSSSPDAFVAKLNAGLTTLIQATYLGGSGTDDVYAMALDSTGNVYVAGRTNSTDFPGLSASSTIPGTGTGADTIGPNAAALLVGFVTKLNPTLTSVVQSTYLSESESQVNSLAVGPAGQVYAAGDLYLQPSESGIDCADSAVTYTGVTCSNGTSPTVDGAQPAAGGGVGDYDAFVAELSSDLQTIMQGTHLGGTGFEFANALAVDGSGNVYVAGYTRSTDFPCASASATYTGVSCASATDGAQPVAASDVTAGGGQDGFVAKLNAGLTTVVQATYLGGSSKDSANALSIDSSGDVYVAGGTGSGDFPCASSSATYLGISCASATDGAEPTGGGAFVAKLSASLTSIAQSTYVNGVNYPGGTGNLNALGLGGGNVYVVGQTGSSSLTGSTGGAQPSNAGNTDAFVVEFKGDLTPVSLSQGPIQATFLGGSGTVSPDEYGYALVISGGQIYVAGQTTSTDFPSTSGGAQPASGGVTYGAINAFVARYDCLTGAACSSSGSSGGGSGGSTPTPGSLPSLISNGSGSGGGGAIGPWVLLLVVGLGLSNRRYRARV